MAIEQGLCEVALITYGSTQKSDRSRNLAGRPPSLGMQFETPFGLPTPMGGYAMAAMRHMHEFGTTSEQLAEIAVAAREWANRNPKAWSHGKPLTVEDVVSSRMISSAMSMSAAKSGSCAVSRRPSGASVRCSTSPGPTRSRASTSLGNTTPAELPILVILRGVFIRGL